MGAAESRLTSKSDPRKKRIGVSVADTERRNGRNTEWVLFFGGRFGENFFCAFNYFILYFLIETSALVFGDSKRGTNREGK